MKKYLNYSQAKKSRFLMLPISLFEEGKYHKYTSESKVLYALMINRLDLSIKNDWRDSNNHIYIYFTVEEIMKFFACGKNKAISLLNELREMELIETVRQLNRPSRIYLYEIDVEDKVEKTAENGENSQKFENQTSGGLESKPRRFENQTTGGLENKPRRFENQTTGGLESKPTEVYKSNSNYNYIDRPTDSKTEQRNTESKSNQSIYPSSHSQNKSSDGVNEEIEKIKKEFLNFNFKNSEDKQIAESLYDLACEVLQAPTTSTYRIAGSTISQPIVAEHFRSITHTEVATIIRSLRKKEMKNPRNCMLTYLYNARLSNATKTTRSYSLDDLDGLSLSWIDDTPPKAEVEAQRASKMSPEERKKLNEKIKAYLERKAV